MPDTDTLPPGSSFDQSPAQAYLSTVQGGAPGVPPMSTLPAPAAAVPGPAASPAAVPPPDPAADLLQQRQNVTDDALKNMGALRQQQMDTINTPVGRPAPPKLRDIPAAPQQKYQDVFKEGMPGLVFSTVMGSMMSKRHGMAAMTAATGYMEGFKKGDVERMELERTNWKNQTDALVKQNEVEAQRYEAAWRGTAMAQQDKMAKANAIAASIGDEPVKAALRNGNIDMAEKIYQDRRDAVERLRVANLKYGTEGSMIDDRAMHTMVDQYMAGDKSVLTNIGKGTQGAGNLARFRNTLSEQMEARGISGAQQAAKMAEFQGYAAAQRLLATREASMGVGTQELISFAGPALEASERLPRGQWVPINKLQQDVQRLSSNPDLRELSNRNAGLITAYSQVISRTGAPTVHAQQRAQELLNTAESQEAYQRAVDTLISEADLALKAPDVIRERMRNSFLGKENPSAVPQRTSPPAGGGGKDDGWKVEKVEPGGGQPFKATESPGMIGAAKSEMKLNPQEEALYRRHLKNLTGPGGVDNPDGSRSTLFEITAGFGDRTYVLPTVWDGKILKPDEAIKRARAEGLDKFPSYGSPEEAEARYNQMHSYMEQDTAKFLRERR